MKISHDETSSLRAPVIEVPAHRNILQYTAEHILNTSGDASPDFSDLSVLLPHSHASEQFNLALSRSLDSSTSAIIPPWSGTLKSWVKQFVDNEHPDHQIISEQSRQLLFIEALQLHPGLFKEENKWQVTQALLGLFDELSLNQQNLFASEEEWQLQLQQAYGIEHPHEHLLYESKLVHTLWHAWKKQLSENKLYDETGDYLSRLSNACTVIDEQQFFLVIGFSSYTKTEQSFIQNLVGRKQCSIIAVTDTIETTSSEHTVFSDFINETFSYRTGSIKSRALRYRNQPPEKSSTDMLFSTYLASNEEEQIRAIDYHVRLNTLEGKRIAIISEDRKLSRRLRALLERAGIQLQDNAGWSLATTQAASIIERWLQCIEEDFSAYPLL
ncbi:MAG TPA: hypothetical protein ENJ87_10615, partial [Gammaproteobacteria bacterium]|nr:hypothetical protein [Gammaproteobacteria bacterium]